MFEGETRGPHVDVLEYVSEIQDRRENEQSFLGRRKS